MIRASYAIIFIIYLHHFMGGCKHLKSNEQ